MINALINSDNKVIGFYGTDIQMKTVGDIPERPSPKPGADHVLYYDEESGGLAYREESRPLTLEERIAAAESKADASMEAIAEIYEQGNK